VAKLELGTKRLCASCGAKFYDLSKDPIHCPKCDTVPEPQEAELVSLEEADAEAEGAKKPAVPGEPGAEEEEVEIDETLDDAAFIEEQEEEDADVTDIIGGDIADEEES